MLYTHAAMLCQIRHLHIALVFLSCLDEWSADLLMEYNENGRWWCVTACDMRQASLSSWFLKAKIVTN